MGFEEVLIRFFDRISRAKKVKSRLMDQSNFSESTRVSQPIVGNKPVGRLPFLLSLLRKTNDAKGLFTCQHGVLCSRQFDSRSKRNCVISVIQLKTYLIMFRQILKEVFAPVGIIMITCDDRVFLQCIHGGHEFGLPPSTDPAGNQAIGRTGFVGFINCDERNTVFAEISPEPMIAIHNGEVSIENREARNTQPIGNTLQTTSDLCLQRSKGFRLQYLNMLSPGIAEHHTCEVMECVNPAIVLDMVSDIEQTLIIVKDRVVVVIEQGLIIHEANHPAIVMYLDDDSVDINRR